MRYAIVSDIHANLPAWTSVEADLRGQAVDMVICLGDVVGYGPSPAEVLHGVRQISMNFVMGNHDAAAVGMMDPSVFNDHAREAIEWTAAQLDAEAREFLSSVPLAIDAGEILFVHAEVCDPENFGYINDVGQAAENFRVASHRVTFVGHTHVPKVFELEADGTVGERPDADLVLDPRHRYIVNVGSVGEPRDPEDLRARYVIYDSDSHEVVFRRVPFDIAAFRRDLDGTSLALRPYFLRVFEHEEEFGDPPAAQEGGTLV